LYFVDIGRTVVGFFEEANEINNETDELGDLLGRLSPPEPSFSGPVSLTLSNHRSVGPSHEGRKNLRRD